MHDPIDLTLPWQVIHGDCLEVMRQLPDGCVDAVVTDPPYGMALNTDYRRFTDSRTKTHARFKHSLIQGDAQPFDPSPWLAYEKVVLWGSNHYAQRLPVGTTLVWVKKSPVGYGTFLSDAEVAWQKGGHGVYCHTIIRASGNERGEHPTQKPVELMRWCISRLRLPPDSLVVDPFCGSGSTGVAAILEGHRFIGLELQTAYVDIARRRIADAAAQTALAL